MPVSGGTGVGAVAYSPLTSPLSVLCVYSCLYRRREERVCCSGSTMRGRRET